jgi:hypothetical protein
MLNALAKRAEDTAAIKAPATNLAIGGSITALVAGVLTVWDTSYEQFFGFKPEDNPAVARAVVVAIIAAVTLLWIADLLARAIASGPSNPTYAAAPEGWTADIDTRDRDDKGYTVAAIRLTDADPEFLLVKAGKAPVWKPLAAVQLITAD